MVFETRPVTIEEFERYILLPENIHRNFEFIAGEIVEKMVSSRRSANVAAWILIQMGTFVLEHDLGTVSGADGGYIVSGERYIPDVSFVSKARSSAGDDVAYYPLPPDLAVEVLSPTNTDEEMRVKVSNYLAAGTVLWLVAPRKRIEVHRPGQPVQVLYADDVLDGGDLLPGFQLSVRDILKK